MKRIVLAPSLLWKKTRVIFHAAFQLAVLSALIRAPDFAPRTIVGMESATETRAARAASLTAAVIRSLRCAATGSVWCPLLAETGCVMGMSIVEIVAIAAARWAPRARNSSASPIAEMEPVSPAPKIATAAKITKIAKITKNREIAEIAKIAKMSEIC